MGWNSPGSKMSALSFGQVWIWWAFGGIWCRKPKKREKMKRKLVFSFWAYIENFPRKWDYLRARMSEN